MRQFASAAILRAERVLVVGGMSSATWQYDGAFGAKYDAACVELSVAFRDAGVSFTSGAAELRGLKLADRIGHVHVESRDVVFAAYFAWVGACANLTSVEAPLLPPLEPLPPPPVE